MEGIPAAGRSLQPLHSVFPNNLQNLSSSQGHFLEYTWMDAASGDKGMTYLLPYNAWLCLQISKLLLRPP